MIEMVSIVHNKYRRVTDVVMRLDFPLVVRFTVDLFNVKPANDGNRGISRPNYYTEYEYDIDGDRKVTIIRNFGYFLEIASSRNRQQNTSAIITAEYLYYFKRRLMELLRDWFIGDAANRTFGRRKDGTFALRGAVDPIKIGIAYNTYIEFEPCVGMTKDNMSIIGARIYINSDSNSYFISIDNLFALYEFLSTFNMYMAAQNILAYMGKPKYGTNQTNLNANGNRFNNWSSSVGNNNGKSFLQS